MRTVCMCSKYGGARRWNNMVGGIIKRRSNTDGPVSALSEDTELDKEGFRELLTSIDPRPACTPPPLRRSPYSLAFFSIKG